VADISKLMQVIGKGQGIALSSNYRVIFTGANIQKYLREGNISKESVELLCDEAQLPNVQTTTAQHAGKYMGQGPILYPHTRLYSDLTLGFICTSDMDQLKFFTNWFDSIFGGKDVIESTEGQIATTAFNRNQVYRLNFPVNYTADIRIIKDELGPTEKGRPSIAYVLEQAYPYSIDSVPLSYGNSQIARVTVNFHYAKHSVLYIEK
jgi:hypothetical protein